MNRTILRLSLLALLPAAALAGDWPGFRGPGGQGVSAETDLPTTWGKDEGLRYKVELPGRGLSNPVIAGGRVFVTACSGYRHGRLHVLCFDEATGKKLWERQLAATGNTLCNPETNMAAGSPATDGKAVYALFGTGDLAAFDRDGGLLWYRSLVGDYPDVTNQVGLAASPVIAGKALLVPLENVGDSFAAGLSAETGKNLWRMKRGRDLNWTTPVVAELNGRPTALFSMPGDITAVDPETGARRWRYEGEGVDSIRSLSVGEGVVFSPADGKLTALRPGAGTQAPEVLWTAEDFSSGYPSPVYHQGRIYGLSQQVRVKCVSAADGKELWRQRIDGPFAASPVIAGGRLYAVNTNGRTTVVQLGDKPKVLAKNDLDDKIQATPAVANGCIYLRSDRYLYCVGPKR